MYAAAITARRADVRATALLIGLVMVSGNPAFSGPAVAPFFLALLAAAAAFAPSKRPTADFVGRSAVLAAAFVCIFVAQQLTLGFVSWPACAYFLAKLLIGGYLLHRIGDRFAPCLFQATYLLSAWSLGAYGLLLLTGPTAFPTLFSEAYLGDNLRSLGFFTAATTDEWWRNSGPMWEPGAFQGVINLAIFLLPTDALLQRRNRARLLVMLLALLTTFSTTGYVVLFLVVLYKIARASGRSLAKVPLFALALVVAVATYTELDFLGEKVTRQFENAQVLEDFSPDRFGALLFDLYYIEKNPWFGNGFHESTRYADHPHLQGEPLGHGNGLSNFVATLGAAGIATYLFGIASSGFGRDRTDRIALAIIVCVLSVGEQFLGYPLFLALPFIGASALARRLPSASLRGTPPAGAIPLDQNPPAIPQHAGP